MSKKIETNEKNENEIEETLNTLPTKSSKIRFLHQKGFKRSEIAKKLDIRYQHVRNVLITPLKKGE